MKDKILALLTAKFPGVRKDGLTNLAHAMCLVGYETDEQITAVVNKLTDQSVGQFVTDYRSDVDKEVTGAISTHETGLKKKFDFVEKTKDSDPGAQKQKQNPGSSDPANLETKFTEILAKALAPLQEKIAGYEKKETADVRSTKFNELFAGKKLPESIKSGLIGGFARMNFTDETDFNTYLEAVKTQIDSIEKDYGSAQLKTNAFTPMLGGDRGKTGTVSPETESYIKSQTEAAKNKI